MPESPTKECRNFAGTIGYGAVTDVDRLDAYNP
jgi:hypothetical protein